MLIKVKMIENNDVKGRAYTYQADFDVTVGQNVVADFGGKERVLRVVETDVEDTSNGEFEIKHIKAIATEEYIESKEQDASSSEEIEIKILQEVAPVITINFDELKSGLNRILGDYKNFVVTEQNLGLCKAKQKELAGLRNRIEDYRKNKKKALSKPITDFEIQCKELVTLIEDIEKPIKECITEFDDVKKNEKRKIATMLIQEVIEEIGLTEKYAAQLTVIDRYCNLTAKASDVREDLKQRAFVLKVEQDKEQELIDIIKDTIESENARINKKLSIEDFQRYINMGISTKEIITMIRNRANDIFEAENPKPVEPEIVQAPETIQELAQEEIQVVEVTAEEVKEEIKSVKRYQATYIVQGTLEELRGVSNYLRANRIDYTTQDQKEI